MILSHVIYKVPNLQDAVQDFQQQGFHVEYGSKTHPHNALIYFSEGPYIELLAEAPIPAWAKTLLKLTGNRPVLDRLDYWAKPPEGLIDICLETPETHLRKEITILKSYKQKYFLTKSKRKDPMDRLLKWKLLFPHELQIPFMMTYFNIDPKPKNFKHPNGITGIKRVAYGTSQDLIPVINALCVDDRLKLFVGEGVRDLEYI